MTNTFSAERLARVRTGSVNTMRRRRASAPPLGLPYKGGPLRLCGTTRADMSPLAHLLLAAAVLHAACAASIPDPHSKLIPDLSDVEIKDPFDKEAAPEIADQTNVIKDLENGLRVKPAGIPVEVLVEDSRPAIKTNEVADDDEEIKRPAIDLRNPGPPQRQEHETQNADHFSDAQNKLSAVRETIMQTQDLLRQGVKGVGDDISNWLSTNEQMNAIQNNIQALKESFTAQIQKLNEGIQELAASQTSKPQVTPEQTLNNSHFNEVETSIKILENNFNNGVRALSEGVNIVNILRAEDESAAAASPGLTTSATVEAASTASSTADGQNFLTNFIEGFQTSMVASFDRVTNLLGLPIGSNRTTTTLAPGVLADTPVSAPQNPLVAWANNFQQNFPNIFPLGQGQQGQTGSNQDQTTRQPVFAQVQQNVGNAFQSLIGLFNSPPAKPNTPDTTETNVVPVKPTGEKQQETPAADALPAPAAPAGPIQQILSNSPVVQGIASTVQRIQSSINNPEKPRDTVKKDDLETKGGFYGGNRPGGSGE